MRVARTGHVFGQHARDPDARLFSDQDLKQAAEERKQK